MLRKLLATGIVFAAGYIVGTIFGFRAAVVDYVENDAESIEKLAEDIYPSVEEGSSQNLPEAVRDAMEEANERPRKSDGDNTADGTAFQ